MATELIGQRPTFTALPNWLRGKTTPLEGWILWCLQSHYPNIHPSMTLLAQEACISRRSVSAVLAGMERKGWLVREHAFSEGGRKMSNRYRLTIWDPHWAIANSAGDALVQEMHQSTRATDALRIGQEVHMDRAGGALGIGQEMPIKKIKRSRSREEEQKKNQEPPFIPPVGERRAERVDTDPYLDQGEFFHNPDPGPHATAINPNPRAAQPQTTQPVKPWEGPQQPPQPEAPPEPQTPLAHAPVDPPNQKRKAGFVPTAEDVPAALLPVVSELLEFWPARSGAKTQRAWKLMLSEAERIQGHTHGGTDILRAQLLQGVKAKIQKGRGWASLDFDRWLQFGTKAGTPISGTGFNRKPTTMETVTGAVELIRQRAAAQAAREAAEAGQQQSTLLLAEVA